MAQRRVDLYVLKARHRELIDPKIAQHQGHGQGHRRRHPNQVHLERRRARPDSFLVLEMRRTCAHKLAERAGEMARILKADSESHFQDVMLTIVEFPLGAFNSL